MVPNEVLQSVSKATDPLSKCHKIRYHNRQAAKNALRMHNKKLDKKASDVY